MRTSSQLKKGVRQNYRPLNQVGVSLSLDLLVISSFAGMVLVMAACPRGLEKVPDEKLI